MPPLQVMINWSKFIIDILQQQCHVTFIIFLLVGSRSMLQVYFCQEKSLQSMKNSLKFQASVTERCTSLSRCSGMFWQNF